MSPSAKIICEFRFECDRTWRSLREISGEPGVRYCTDCAKPVFLCHTYEELAGHVAQAHCVAIDGGSRGMRVGEAGLVYGVQPGQDEPGH